MPSKKYTNKTFWPKFKRDLMRAIAHVIIQSAFISRSRILDLKNIFMELIRKGVVICVFLQMPDINKRSTAELDEFESLCDLLRSWGVHVNIRTLVHSKLVFIDGEVMWEGSLNALSQSERNDYRSSSEFEVKRIAKVSKRRNPIAQAKSRIPDLKLIVNVQLECAQLIRLREKYGKPKFRYDFKKEHMRRWTDKTEIREVLETHELLVCCDCYSNSRPFQIGGFEDPLARLGEVLSMRRKLISINEKLTQKDLAKLVNASRQRIGEIESGKNITVSTLAGISDALESDVLIIPKCMTPTVCSLLQKKFTEFAQLAPD